ncbi:hypothetical protein RSAG8_06169, partial [Rhizoctonia solani AG-8 WAC10335]
MSSEHIVGAAANTQAPGPTDVIENLGHNNQSQARNWWESAVSPSLRWILTTMSSEHIVGAAVNTQASGPTDVIENLGRNNQSQARNWWESAVSPSLRSATSTERDALLEVSPLGERCVITGSVRTVGMAHLIPKCINSKEVCLSQLGSTQNMTPDILSSRPNGMHCWKFLHLANAV